MWAFGRLILIAVFSLFVLVFGVIGINMLGQNQTPLTFSHPIADNKNLNAEILFPNASDLQAVDGKLAEAQPFSTVFFLDISPTTDGKWVLVPHSDLKAHTEREVMPLLSAHQSQYFFINVHHPKASVVEALYAELMKLNSAENLIISSLFMDTLISAREKNVRWLTDLSTSEKNKAYLFANLFLDALIQYPGEVILMTRWNARLASAALKNHRVVFYQPKNESERESLQHEYANLRLISK